MIENNKHIVSRVTWETSFNKKDLAFGLQSEISRWGKLKLADEISRVFDELCPSEQVWKIDSLELDLGQIDYADLHGSLSRNFSKELSKQLKELLFYASSKNSKIDIVDNTTSKLSLLKSYLSKGYMPWWYKSERGNIHEVLQDLLKTDRTETINLLRYAGKSDDVRRRMSWQFNHDALIKIVVGLEPNNHQQIIEFKDKFVDIQNSDKIVQTNSSDFSREAWFWVLSHILVERGSLFNKVTFMKSMLAQMAFRYNFKYGSLIELIERTIKILAINSPIQSDFIITLTIISEENKLERKKIEASRATQLDYWSLLEKYLLGKNDKTNKLTSADVNDLISSLSRENKPEFVTWLLTLKKDSVKWSALLLTSNEKTYGILIHALAPVHFDNLIATIRVLSKLLISNQFSTTKNDLWSLSLNYLTENKNRRIDTNSYTKHLVDVLAEKEKISKLNLLAKCTQLKNWPNDKSKTSIELYVGMNSLFKEEIGVGSTDVLNQRINELLHKLEHHALNDKKLTNLNYELLVRWAQTNPKETFVAMLQYEQKDRLQEFLNTYLKNRHAHLIIEKLNNKSAKIVCSVQEVLKELCSNNALAPVVQLIEDKLMLIGLQIMLIRPNLSNVDFIKELLAQSSRVMSKKQLELFNELIDHLLGHKKILATQISKAGIIDLKKNFQVIKDQEILIRTHELISNSGSDRIEIGNFLLNNFKDEVFVAARKSDDDDLQLILNYLVQNGSLLKSSLIADAMRKLTHVHSSSQKSKISTELLELFWKCVLLYQEHKGDTKKFKILFNKAIAFHFNRNTGIIKADRPKVNTGVQLKSGIQITQSKLQNIVAKGIEVATLTIKDKKLAFDLSECLQLGLELDAEAIQSTLSKISIADKRIKNLAEAISFTDFCMLISSKIGMKSFFVATGSLHKIVRNLGSNELIEKLLFDFWKLTWRAIQATRMNANSFSKFVQKVIFEIAKEKNVKASHILEEIRSNNIVINVVLKNSLLKVHEVFELIPDQEKATIAESNLEKCESNGLLEELTSSLLINKQVPSWYSGMDVVPFETTLNEIIEHHPIVFLKTFRYDISAKDHKAWISNRADAEVLLKTIKALHPNLSSRMDMLLKLYKAFFQLSIGTVSGNQLQAILLDKILLAWSTNYWKLLSTENVWNELMWEMCTKRGVSSEQFLSAMQTLENQLPSALQISLNYVLKKNKKPLKIINNNQDEIMEKPILTTKQEIQKEGIVVKNAGMVLMADYFKMLFDRLGLLKENVFLSDEAQLKSIHYLQYIVTGHSSTLESMLPLNKVICGIELNAPIPAGIEITADQSELINGLIKAVIGYWPAIGETSIDGFRGNWLVRDGMLTEHEDKWELVVEKRAYDLLISKSPFAFSIIKYPWMEKPIHVTWPY